MNQYLDRLRGLPPEKHTDRQPTKPTKPSSDGTGLVWLLDGKVVTALTATTADIQHKTGAITVYRKLNKPALGPLGDSLEDFV